MALPLFGRCLDSFTADGTWRARSNVELGSSTNQASASDIVGGVDRRVIHGINTLQVSCESSLQSRTSAANQFKYVLQRNLVYP